MSKELTDQLRRDLNFSEFQRQEQDLELKRHAEYKLNLEKQYLTCRNDCNYLMQVVKECLGIIRKQRSLYEDSSMDFIDKMVSDAEQVLQSI